MSAGTVRIPAQRLRRSAVTASQQAHSVRSVIPWVTTVARLVLGITLIVAGWLKIGSPAESITAVKAYQLLPDAIATTVGYGLPILEIVVGVLLVVGLLTRVAAVVAALLMAAFVFGIAWAWTHGLRIDCGCFGGGGQLKAGQEPQYFLEILRDFGLTLLGLWTARFPSGRFSLDSALGLSGGSREIDEENE
ncbi:MAG: DoxX family membrane protein [Nonomuraea sp.]|nr:DoxX family membrane protein [Nonomuraea sp.]